MADPGKGVGGAWAPSLFWDQTEARKIFWLRPGYPDPPPPFFCQAVDDWASPSSEGLDLPLIIILLLLFLFFNQWFLNVFVLISG